MLTGRDLPQCLHKVSIPAVDWVPLNLPDTSKMENVPGSSMLSFRRCAPGDKPSIHRLPQVAALTASFPGKA
jgi:hypothetical protein